MNTAAESEALVSVIVLVHNAAPTVERALDSIAAQTLVKGIELVVVDDGSTDTSLTVVEQWIQAHPHRFTQATIVSHHCRRGVAAATTTGLKQATGRYVVRCDADDAMMPRALEAMAGEALRGEVDVVWGHTLVDDGCRRRLVKSEPRWADLNDAPVTTAVFALWNKLIRRSLIVDNALYPFEGADCWEDLGMVARVLALRPRVAMVDEPVYVYHDDPRRATLSRSRREVLLRDHLHIALMLEQWFVTHGLDSAYEMWLCRVKLCAKVKYLRGRGKDVARWKATFPEVNDKILGISQVGFHYRLLFASVWMLPTALTQRVADVIEWLGARE